ncbi:MAG: HEAT repeat domain-containing protein [candidate division Zixibacteria bacterium]|nr:HEAT repeat domain-containing protein [candidate division Zixibacteria bacterium]
MKTSSVKADDRFSEIGFILKDLLKVIKVVSIYPEDNPLPQSLKQSFSEKLVSLIDTYGDIPVSVEKDNLILEGQVMYHDRSKEEALAGLFFDAGIAEFAFKSGLDVNNVYKLLDIIREYKNSIDKSKDLADLIWEAGVAGFTFRTVEDVALTDYDSNFNIQEFLQEEKTGKEQHSQLGFDTAEKYKGLFNEQSEGYREVSKISLEDSKSINASKAMGMDIASDEHIPKLDTAFVLDDQLNLTQEEDATIREQLVEDADFDFCESTLDLLKEMLLQESEMNSFYETVTIYEKVLTEFIRIGRLPEAGQLLRHLKKFEQQIRPDKELWAERLRDARITAGSRDRLNILFELLNACPDLGVGELRRYLDNFGWEALGGITDLLGELEHQMHREALTNYLIVRGADNIDIVSKGIFDKRWYVVRNTVTVLAGIGNTRALDYLKRVVTHEDRRVRLELVSSLVNCPNDEALNLLRECATAPDPEIRKEAINAIIARRSEAALNTITDLMNDDGFLELDEEDQRILLIAFSTLGGDMAVSYFSDLILKFNPFRESNAVFYRTTAFEALTVNRSEKCEKLLVKLASNWRPNIKKQAAAALQKRREVMYGEQ